MENGNWKPGMEKTVSATTATATRSSSAPSSPLHGYAADDMPRRLRPVFDRSRRPPDQQVACDRSASHAWFASWPGGRPPSLIERAPLDGAGEALADGGDAACRSARRPRRRPVRRVVPAPPAERLVHLISDHAVIFSVLPLAPDRTLPAHHLVGPRGRRRGRRLRRQTLAHVWPPRTCRTAPGSRAPSAVCRTPATSHTVYSEVEGDVEAFVTWYISRVNAHLSRPNMISAR